MGSFACTVGGAYFPRPPTSFPSTYFTHPILGRRMAPCSNPFCQTRASYSVQGSKKAIYCKRHAKDGMVNAHVKRFSSGTSAASASNVEGTKMPAGVRSAKDYNAGRKLCSHGSCKTAPSFNIDGIRPAMFCKHHSKDGMLHVYAKRCLHPTCTTRASFNIGGSKAVYCKLHAQDGMIDVLNKVSSYSQCSHATCTLWPSFNVEGSKGAAYCKRHAVDGMVDVCSSRCLFEACKTKPSFNVEGGKPAYCKVHAKNGMVNVHYKRCAHATCKKSPSFNIKGMKKAAYCKTHAKDGMVDVRHKHCSHKTCTKTPSFNFEGSKQAMWCKEHAENGMILVSFTKRCSQSPCARLASWGSLAGGTGIVCAAHRSVVMDGPVVNFRAMCKVAGCRAFATWGNGASQPSHCNNHGPRTDGLVLTVPTKNTMSAPIRSSDGGLTSPSLHFKTEVYF